MRVQRIVLFFVLIAGGCSRQDFSQPVVFNELSNAMEPRKSNARTPKKPPTNDMRTEKVAKLVGSLNQQTPTKPEDYRLGPSDELDIGVFALESPEQTTHLQRIISREGFISLPWVGDLIIKDLSVRQAEELIKKAYGGRYIKNPQITVQVTQHHSVAVLMTGAVKNPGIFYLTDNQSTLLDMLAKSGGLRDDASDELLLLHGRPADVTSNSEASAEAKTPDTPMAAALLTKGRDVTPVSLKGLVDEGDLSLNLDVGAGDIIVVRPMSRRFIYVLGYVQSPGAFEMKGPQVDALRAVALAGGLGASARAENSFIVRDTTEGQKVIPVDLIKAAQGVRAAPLMEAGDTLVVASGFFARLAEFVRPGASATTGVSYSPLKP